MLVAGALFICSSPIGHQYSFMLSLTGIGWTDSYGTAIIKYILSPLLIGEKGLPWAVPGGPYGRGHNRPCPSLRWVGMDDEQIV